MTRHAPKSRSLPRTFACTAIAVALGGAAVGGCADRDENQVLTPSIVGMTQNTPPFYSDTQTSLFEVQIPVRLPMRRPNDDERAGLPAMAGFPRTPFLKVDDVDITVRFTLANLDNEKRTVELLLDPWNEFVRYKPIVEVVNQDVTTPDYSGFDKFFVLGPLERFEGIITPDDTREMAIDLAVAELLVAQPPPQGGESANGLINRAFNLQNRSSAFDPLLSPIMARIPTVPGLVGFDLGLRTNAAMNVAVEVIVDVHDKSKDKNRVVPSGQDDKTFGPPGTILSPPAPPRK